ncbi:MAG: hypothetical protein J0H97_22260 [Alphaproteobacteria bacterium]|nr:hypothetical protein [Alphaproteobacteria bacterium]
MDKTDFIKLAPAYYEAAVLVEVWERDGYFSLRELQRAYIDHDGEDEYSFLQNNTLLGVAIGSLVQQEAMEVVSDPFGPTLYKRGAGIAPVIERLQADQSSPFYKSGLAGDRRAWIFAALRSLSSKYLELEINDQDLATPDLDWEPIPIDRANEKFLNAEAAVARTVKEVEESNGYASQYPEERATILDSLKALQERLRTAKEISVGYVKAHGVEVLRKLSARFGNAAIGRLADAAISALLSWLGLK